jgi:hypothetical protein
MSLSEPIRRLLPFTPHGARRQFCQFRKLCEPGRLSGQGLRIVLYAGHKGTNVTSMDGKSTGRGNACTSRVRSTAAKKSRSNSRNGGESSRADCAFQQECFRRCRFLSVAWIIKQFECFRRQWLDTSSGVRSMSAERKRPAGVFFKRDLSSSTDLTQTLLHPGKILAFRHAEDCRPSE